MRTQAKQIYHKANLHQDSTSVTSHICTGQCDKRKSTITYRTKCWQTLHLLRQANVTCCACHEYNLARLLFYITTLTLRIRQVDASAICEVKHQAKVVRQSANMQLAREDKQCNSSFLNLCARHAVGR
eukprot:3957726-Amphidinium_carterae.1